MKRIIIMASVLLLVGSTVQAQKLLSTKTAKIAFYSKAPLEDIEAKNNEAESKLSTANGQMVFSLLIKGFQFKNRLMQDHFNENYMESDKFPKSDFKGYITNIKEIDFTKDGVYPTTINGKLTIHGITQDLQTTGTIVVKNGKVSGTSKFNVLLKDYGIGGALVGKKIGETIAVTVDSEYE